ncbi:hypothetical protein BDB01DRAFT_849641 [Pilobolus umbonatus]|nr:hypothetical protein BDB01DRAFT_849641 [Pilobolus umbonatus]
MLCHRDTDVLAQSTEIQMLYNRDKDVLASKGRGDDERDHTKRGGEETGGGGTSVVELRERRKEQEMKEWLRVTLIVIGSEPRRNYPPPH